MLCACMSLPLLSFLSIPSPETTKPFHSISSKKRFSSQYASRIYVTHTFILWIFGVTYTTEEEDKAFKKKKKRILVSPTRKRNYENQDCHGWRTTREGLFAHSHTHKIKHKKIHTQKKKKCHVPRNS